MLARKRPGLLFRLRAFFLLAAFTSVVGACAPVPLDAPKPVTRADLAPPSAELKQAAGVVAAKQNPNHSTVIPLAEGNEALGARLRLIERAQHAVDLQYFLLKPDLAGALLSQALLDAADRGVRVRFLVDDIFTTTADDVLALLDAHPNIEMRVFNPARRPGPKAVGLLTEFSRVNRRMHNKTFTVDGAVAILGGRNIADEYYQIQTDSEFADFEVLLMGPVVSEVEQTFDIYWNDGWSVPISELHDKPSAQEFENARLRLSQNLVPAREVFERAVNDPHFERLSSGKENYFSARATVVADVPDKVKQPVRGGSRLLAENLLRRVKAAEDSVVIVTPYFVPEDYGARLLMDLAARGVKVVVITNSIGSTNHAYVHAGYRRHRKDLLEVGVELYEIRPDALQVLGELPADDARGIVMHTKLVVIDRDEVFVGSLNFDPRSVKLNTEGGVFLDDPAFGDYIHFALVERLEEFTYRLSLSDNARLLWHYDHAVAPSVSKREPGMTVWKQIIVGVTEILGVELQL